MWGQSLRDCPKPSGEEAGVLGMGWGRVKATRQRKDAKSRGVIRLVFRLARACIEFLYGKGLVWFELQ